MNESSGHPDDAADQRHLPGAVLLSRRRLAQLLVAAGAGPALAATVGSPAAAAPVQLSPQSEPLRARNVVLVHGAYADGSCWSEVIGRLQRAGLRVMSVQNPLSALADDVAATRRALDLQAGPTVLVGHSFAGTVISQAGVHPKVSALVYVAARAPDADEDYAALADEFPTPPATAGLEFNEGFGQLNEESFLRDFANGIPRPRARVLYAAQGRVAQTLFSQRTTVAAWRSTPSWYAVSRRDRTTAPELERFLAHRMRAATVEIDSGHLSLITHPREIADLILDAARGTR